MINPIKAFLNWQDSSTMKRMHHYEKNQSDLKFLRYARIAVISVFIPSILIVFIDDFGLYELIDWDDQDFVYLTLFSAWNLNWLSEAILFRKFVSENRKT